MKKKDKIEEFIATCPVCGEKTLRVVEMEYSVPYLGKVLLINKHCTNCHFKKSEMVPLMVKKHKRIYVRIGSREDFKVKIVRTSTTAIEIPEYGMSMHPGIDAPFFITNVEGVLQRFYDAAKRIIILSNSEGEGKQVLRFMEKNRLTELPFTLILDDPAGLANIFGDKKLKFILVENVEGE